MFLVANVIFSASYKESSPLLELWQLPDTQPLCSIYCAEEARRNLVMHKPEQVDTLERLLAAVIIVADHAPNLDLPEGIELAEKDRPILLAAIQSESTHLLTGDKEHFGAYYGQTIGSVVVLRPRDYLRARAS